MVATALGPQVAQRIADMLTLTHGAAVPRGQGAALGLVVELFSCADMMAATIREALTPPPLAASAELDAAALKRFEAARRRHLRLELLRSVESYLESRKGIRRAKVWQATSSKEW